MIIIPFDSSKRPKLTDCSLSVSSRRRFLHLAAASLFLSRRTRLFSSSSGVSWDEGKKKEDKDQNSLFALR